MEKYKNYLEQENFSKSTIYNYYKEVEKFTRWCSRNQTSVELIDYKTFLQYMQHLQQKETSRTTVQKRVIILKNYFNYLVLEYYREANPIEDIRIKGVRRVMNYNYLEPDELEDLYYSFDTENYQEDYHRLTAKRNKIIVGLMVYQGLNTTELRQLELEDLQLYKGKVYIKSGKCSNSRTLELKSWQVIELLEYVKEFREEIKHKWQLESERLFIPNNKRLSNTVLRIVKELKKTNHKVKNAHQIRASVIANWLKQYNLRQVQILAGHRYISSTERYLQDDLENLHEIVNNFHPIS